MSDVKAQVVSSPEILIEDDGYACLWRQWLPEPEAQGLFTQLADNLHWQQTMIRVYGRRMPIPRLNAWYGDAGARYTYSGARFTPEPWTDELEDVRQRLTAFTGTAFNSVLANLYRDGSDSVAWHSDNEPELGAEPAIASLSLGASRRFRLRHRHLPPVAVDLHAGDLLLMTGPLQQHWQHALPKTRRSVGARINLTFRRVVNLAV